MLKTRLDGQDEVKSPATSSSINDDHHDADQLSSFPGISKTNEKNKLF